MRREACKRKGKSLGMLAAVVLLAACSAPSETGTESLDSVTKGGGAEESFFGPEEDGRDFGAGQEEFLSKEEDGSAGDSGAGREEIPSGEEPLADSGADGEEFPAVDGEGLNGEEMAGESGEFPETGKAEITLVMVGDILLHTPVAESGRLEEGGYDFSAVFSQMKEEISAADLALVNQEVIIGGEELGITGYPAFNAPYELGDALVEAGFDVVLHATNHALDKGKKGILNCLSFWKENYPDIAVLGVHDSEEARQEIYVYEQKGIRIAVLNYTYGTNGIPLPEGMSYAVDLLEKARVADDLERAEELADFVIVCPHWGTEYVLESTRAQRDWAAFFAENGADLILGTHPHVIEEIDWVSKNGSESGEGTSGQDAGNALVYYSLGNFVNWTAGTGAGVANRMVGGMAKVTIGLNERGEAVILSYGVEPLVCHVEQGFGGVRVYPLSEYTEELAARNEIVGQDENFSLEYCQELVAQVFGELAGED